VPFCHKILESLVALWCTCDYNVETLRYNDTEEFEIYYNGIDILPCESFAICLWISIGEVILFVIPLNLTFYHNIFFFTPV
jgi:hypothetical protein